MNQLRQWMLLATTEEKALLAERCETSVNYLHHIAGAGVKKYGRHASAALGARIEQQTKVMNRASGGRLPVVYRTDVVAACSACPYAQKCLGERALISEFQHVVTPELLAAAEADSEGGDHD